MAAKLDKLGLQLTGRLDLQEKAILKLFAQIKALVNPPSPEATKRRIGF